MAEKEDIYKKGESDEGISLEEQVRILTMKFEILTEKYEMMDKELGTTNKTLANTTETVLELKCALKEKNGKRRDYDLMASDLMEKIKKDGRYIDYKDVKNIFELGTNGEAHRLMDRTRDNFPYIIGMKEINIRNRRKRVLYKIVE